MHYLLFYDVVPDYATKRMPYRGSHLAYAQQAVDRGELILGGALANPVDASILLFRHRRLMSSSGSRATIPMCATAS